jgi:hypothetical protein
METDESYEDPITVTVKTDVTPRDGRWCSPYCRHYKCVGYLDDPFCTLFNCKLEQDYSRRADVRRPECLAATKPLVVQNSAQYPHVTSLAKG